MNQSLRIAKKIMLLFGIVLLSVPTALSQSYQNGVRRGMIKVKFDASMTKSLSNMKVTPRSSGLTTGIQSLDATAKQAGAKNMYRLFPYDARYEQKLRKHGLHLWYVVELSENDDPKSATTKFKQLKEVKLAEVEHEKIIAPYTVVPYSPGITTYEVLPFNDPFLKDQWHYNNTGQSGFGDGDVNLFEAWTKTAGANNIIVSVHDQGIDVNHKDLKRNIWVNQAELSGVANVDDDNNGYIDDINGYNFQKNKGAVDAEFHGTHVAGTIAAVNNNGIGVSGVAGGTGNGDGVKLMSLQIFGGLFENSYIYAANNGAVISQNSWGYSNPYYFDQSIKEAIEYFVAEAGDFPDSPMKGGLVIFAAGNSNYDSEWYPGYFSNVMAVASIGPEWKKAAYSNFGTWIEISATGGDQNYNSKSGVLSTVPKDQYAYLQGTSMACPHMSGIAALALANRTKQLSNTELWNKLVTGVVNIDEYNPDYIGKMGSGAVDAALAIQNDLSFAPAGITTLAVTGIAQEFATLTWNVPTDNDDVKPVAFQLYVSTQPITSATLSSVTKIIIKNNKSVGQAYEYEVTGLLGVTTYYFAITSTDRWGNVSELSNMVSETTNNGPSIAVDENSQSINFEVDVTNSPTTSHELSILNKSEGILRWNHLLRHSSASLSFNASGLNYPTLNLRKTSADLHIGKRNLIESKNPLRSNEANPSSFTSIEKSYLSYVTNIIGDMDTALTNSSATKFFVSETDGFNLTQVRAYLKHDPAKGPIIVEIHRGESPSKNNLVFAQEYSSWGTDETWAYITLNEQLYFESGETFWVVVHVPSGNLYPLGMGYEAESSYSKNCFMSFNLGMSWVSLEEAINDKNFVWAVSAVSENAALNTYLTLQPGSGDVDGNSETMTTLTADASILINGMYSANLVITSNDTKQKELRVPVNLTVSGQQPNLKHVDIADFGSVFIGIPKTLELVIDNQGYGNFNDPIFTLNSDQFTIGDDKPWQIKAREQGVVKVTLTPTTAGNINDVLTITNGNQTYEIPLFAVGAETSKIVITPETQTRTDIRIGDVVTTTVTVENAGAYPLKYFIPGFDSKGISTNWPTNYHTYGYKVRSNQSTESNPIPYAFQDIKTTGVDVTSQINSDFKYYTLDIGFDFPYYGQKMQTLYIAQKGFTTFDNTVNPVNTPSLSNSYNPRGYISPLGSYFSYITQGQIFYQVEADRVIVQFDNVWDGYNPETITAQMVLFANGDIRFYYEKMDYTEYNRQGLSILIEDYNQEDGILINSWQKPTELFSGLALGFDYPGPDIITSIENGSGIIAPGSTAAVNITMNTETLAEGMVNRYVNFISNDPSKSQANALMQLEIKFGGEAKAFISTDTIAFGNVFQGGVKSSLFTVKNLGTANVDISSMTFVNGGFSLLGDRPTSIRPGLYKNYEVHVPTISLATLEDWLSINYTDGSQDTLYISASVVEAPAINIDLSLLQQTLAYGDSISIPFSIENTGLGTLELTAIGKQWLSFDAPVVADDITYTYEKENTGGVYQWIDIRKTGTHLPFVDFADFNNTFWRTLDLPFPIDFYGVKYDSFKIGDNGVISLGETPEPSFFTDYIPSTSLYPGPCIMPYWTFSGFSDYAYAKEDIGIFYQAYEDKFIITWSYFVNNFGGMGDPVSAQVIFYKNGTMKFQYKAEEGGADLTSRFSSIGLQKDSSNGIAISSYLELDYGKGLAYVIVPAKKLSIAANSTLTGQINLDARNVFGGVYNEMLKIKTNVPGNENLEKPIELTVIGEAVFTAPGIIDLGNKMITFEFGAPTIKTMDLKFTNEGAAPYDISWAQMADASQGLSLQIYTQVDGWFGPEWRWADISEIYSPWALKTPTFTIMPGDVLEARAAFFPSTAGDFIDELVLTTSLGEQRIILKGTGVEPPVISVNKTPIVVMMNTTTETANEAIAFGNIEGKSDLTYSLSIEYGRAGTTQATAPTTPPSGESNTTLHSTKAFVKGGIRTLATYNRILTHTEKQTPDTFIGNGGSASITIATKYKAGDDGFNLSHIETWLRTETLPSGTINVEILAGGTSISTASIVATGKLEFTGSGADETGKFYQVKIDKATVIYPNENFYISVTYPFGIAYPQGSIDDSETISERYFYFEEGVWHDIQNESGFETIGWLMFAAEETAGSTTWLSITSSTEGILAMGEESTTNLHFDGAIAEGGDQLANIVFTSNDPVAPIVRVPVTLHLNEGPHFSGSTTNIVMAEKDTVTLNFNVSDVEGHTFAVMPSETYSGVHQTLSNGKLTVVLTPSYSDAGNHIYIFKATDQFNAVSELTLSVEVIETNQAPIYIGSATPMEFNGTGKLIEHNIGDFFSDPDGDEFIFEVSSADPAMVEVFASSDKFLIKTQAGGETELNFKVTDSQGAAFTKSVIVKVNLVLGLEPENNKFVVYPNPVVSKADVILDASWRGEISLMLFDLAGRTHLFHSTFVSGTKAIELDLSRLTKGLYILGISSKDQKSFIKLLKD
jgi:subtilisin family serine protease